jgi:4-hydroxythreonine-4-phosphate dehydrogenase
MDRRIGIALGDFTGIGPEVTLKALADRELTRNQKYLLIGDERRTRELNEALGMQLPLETASDSGSSSSAQFLLFDPVEGGLPPILAPGCEPAARAALVYLRVGAEGCLAGDLSALVTAPVNKEAILRTGEQFIGQTEFLASLAGGARVAMMLLGADDQGRWLRVALATTHVPIRRVAEEVTGARVESAIELAAQACRDLGLERARVGVCGLNPHAGEGGTMGTEEGEVITPAIRRCQGRQLDVSGPYAADTLFYYAFRGEYDAVVAMYHDQGLVALKMIGFERGINWTLGLPFIRTSPDHGTGYDIAGRGLAQPSSMMAAIELAQALARKRENGQAVA